MRRLTITILLAAASLYGCYAEPVTRRQATDYAARRLHLAQPLGARTSAEIPGFEHNGAAPTFYVIDNPDGGWVIISGDNCTRPVLAYSDKGRFNTGNIPGNVRSWLCNIDKGISELRRKGVSPGRNAISEWASAGTGTRNAASEGKELKTACWSQQSPFCDLCPRPTAGCVAVTVGIVMRFHQWPGHGQGYLPSYVTKTEGISVEGYSIGSHRYDWDNMPLDWNSTWPESSNKEVATLIHDIGVMVKTDYCTGGASAFTSDIIPAMAEFMDYSTSAIEINRDNYSDAEWYGMIRDEIDAGRPIIYGGVDGNIGHEFVCDGYDGNGYIHVNWGWNGECNGYYAVTYPGDNDPNGIGHVFDSEVSAIIGICPSRGGASGKYDTEVQLYAMESAGLYGIKTASGSIDRGGGFTLDIGYLVNYSSYAAYDGAIRVALMDSKGTIKEYIGDELPLHIDKATSNGSFIYPGSTSIKGYKCRITSEVKPGDYITAFYRHPDGRWTRTGGGRGERCTLSALGVFDICHIRVGNDYTDGELYYPDIIPGHKAIASSALYYDAVLCSKGYAELHSGKHEIKVTVTFDDGSSESIIQEVTVR